MLVKLQAMVNEDNHLSTKKQTKFFNQRKKRMRAKFTITIVDFECVTIFSIPHSSNLISSSFSEIISNISLAVRIFCRLERSKYLFSTKKSVFLSLSTGCCSYQCKYSLIIKRSNEFI